MAKLIKVKCKNCGWLFATYANRPAFCCCKACYNAYRKKSKGKPVIINCRNCGIEIEVVHPSQIFCSKQCKINFERKLARAKLKRNTKICAYEFCENQFITDGRTSYCCKEHAQAQKLINDRDRIILRRILNPDEALKALAKNPWRVKFSKERLVEYETE